MSEQLVTDDASNASNRRTLDIRSFDFVSRLAFLAGLLAVAATLGLLVLSGVEVVARNLMGASVPAIIPIQETLMAFMIFVGLAYTQRVGAHVRVELLEVFLGDAWIYRARGFVTAAVSVGFFVFAYYTALEALASLEVGEYTSSGGTDWPRYPARLALSLGFLLSGFVCLTEGIVLLLRGAERKASGMAMDDSEPVGI